MALVLVCSVLLAVSAPPEAMPLTPPPPERCWVMPLRLTLPELAAMGRVEEQYARSYCMRQPGASYARHLNRPFTLAQTRFANFSLFGERLGFGFDLVVQPGMLGAPDRVYTVPSFDLPPSWAWALDTATYPVVIVGGAAIVTTVIIELLRERQPQRRPSR
jgi:hypothetical protein